MTMEMTTEWICMPCYLMVPDRSGHVTVYEEKDEKVVVWCPWCGDKMERAEEQLMDGELKEIQERSNGHETS